MILVRASSSRESSSILDPDLRSVILRAFAPEVSSTETSTDANSFLMTVLKTTPPHVCGQCSALRDATSEGALNDLGISATRGLF